jgi:DNA-binding NarL/FixJ family response regulator
VNNQLSVAADEAPAGNQGTREPLRVVVLGGYALTRASLKALLNRQPGLLVIGEAGTRAAASAQIHGRPVDVFVLDFDADADAAIESIEELRAADREARVLVLIAPCDREIARRAVLAGASGVVFKDRSSEHLLSAILKIHEGELWVDRATTAQLISDLAARRRQETADPERAKIQSLSSREREVIELVGQGRSNKRIAARMAVSEHTIRHHLTSIFAKLGLSDRLELAVYALRHKLSQQTR